MIKIGIIGCGKMADQHVAQIRRIPDVEITAVCDKEPLMAQDMSERFNIKRHFTDAKEMVNRSNFDVVHITTPPQSHHPLAKMCLESGCNVYIEKPFTLDTAEAEDLIKYANQKRLKLTAGHNAQFTHAMVRMRELVKAGYLGGAPVHLESHYCYDFGDESYAKALLGNKNHWVRQLPGSLLQNIISHGISKIAEFLTGENPKVIAHCFTSPFLKRIGPVPHQFRLYGSKNSLIVDDDHQILIKLDNKEYKSYLRYFFPPFGFAKQYLGNFGRNFKKFLVKDFHLPNNAALKTLITLFYQAVANDEPLPLSYREIILTSKIMDEIFSKINNPKV